MDQLAYQRNETSDMTSSTTMGEQKTNHHFSNIEAIFIWMMVEEAFQCGGVAQGAEGLGGEVKDDAEMITTANQCGCSLPSWCMPKFGIVLGLPWLLYTTGQQQCAGVQCGRCSSSPCCPLLTKFVNLTKVSHASVSTFLMFVCGDDGGDGDAKAMHCNVV